MTTYKDNRTRIWHNCIECGTGRSVVLKGGQPRNLRCGKCRGLKGSDSPNWRGGRHIDDKGYVNLRISQDDPVYHLIANPRGYILEHRLVMTRYLKRRLKSYEIVHHRNGVKDDNRLENLQLMTSVAAHLQMTWLEERIKELEGRVTVLEAENAAFRGELIGTQPALLTK